MPVDRVFELNEEQQRRLILRSAREVAPKQYRLFLSTQPSLAEMERDFRRRTGWYVAGSVVGLFSPCLLWVAPTLWFVTVAPLRKVRGHAIRNWRTLVGDPVTPEDAEVEVALLAGGIRRQLRRLTHEHHAQRERVTEELQRAEKHWREFKEKQSQVEAMLRTTTLESLEYRRSEIEARIELEEDHVVLASLRRRLSAVSGQIEAFRGLDRWSSRLDAAMLECTESLQELRCQLTLLSASGTAAYQAAYQAASEDLRDLNQHMSATQAASEEVLRLGAAW